MIKALLFDLSRTLLFPKDKSYSGGLNDLYQKLSGTPDFDFLNTFELNKGLLKYLETIKEKVKLYIFTSESIQNDPAISVDLDKLFVDIFSAKEIGYSKKDSEAYKYIAKEISFNPKEILFIDDSEENLIAGKEARLTVFQYKTSEETISHIKKVLK